MFFPLLIQFAGVLWWLLQAKQYGLTRLKPLVPHFHGSPKLAADNSEVGTILAGGGNQKGVQACSGTAGR